MRVLTRWPLALLLLSATAAADDGSLEAKRLYERAVAFVRDGDFAHAVLDFERAYAIKPHYSVLYNIGRAYLELNDAKAATQAFETYLELGGEALDEERRTIVLGLLERISTPDDPKPPVPPALSVDDTGEPKPKPGRGLLKIECDVPDATISVDGVPVGRTTPRTLLFVVDGTRTLSITRAGYQEDRATLDVANDTEVHHTCRLAPLPHLPGSQMGTLNVHASVAGSRVVVDGRALTGTGRLPVGRHRVNVSRSGYRDWSGMVEVESGRERQLTVTLERAEQPSQASDRVAPTAWAYGLGASGLALVAVAGGTKLWNVARASSWREKQTRLDEAWDTEAPTQSLVRRQTDNDALARSINALDSLAIAMALGGAVLTTGGVLTFVLSDRTSPEHATLTATPTGVWLSATW